MKTKQGEVRGLLNNPGRKWGLEYGDDGGKGKERVDWRLVEERELVTDWVENGRGGRRKMTLDVSGWEDSLSEGVISQKGKYERSSFGERVMRSAWI